MAIVIESYQIPGSTSLLFSVVSDITVYSNIGYEWYLNDVLVGTDDTYTLVNPYIGDNVYVKIKNYSTGCPTYWYDGNFYGGTFIGNFSGGTFHYGLLNSVRYNKQAVNSKYFINKIK